jgi:RimJ/RimL family protein N-acetyltransferase
MNTEYFHIREAALTDAEYLVIFFEKLDSETHYMLFEPGERNKSIEEQEQLLKDIVGSDSKVLFVVESNGDVVGFAAATGGLANRNRHSAFIAIGVLQAYWRRGIGRQLLQFIESWAKEHDINRLDLNVSPHNHRAIDLYEKFGFARAGIKRNSLLVDGQYISEVYMDKLI